MRACNNNNMRNSSLHLLILCYACDYCCMPSSPVLLHVYCTCFSNFWLTFFNISCLLWYIDIYNTDIYNLHVHLSVSLLFYLLFPIFASLLQSFSQALGYHSPEKPPAFVHVHVHTYMYISHTDKWMTKVVLRTIKESVDSIYGDSTNTPLSPRNSSKLQLQDF